MVQFISAKMGALLSKITLCRGTDILFQIFPFSVSEFNKFRILPFPFSILCSITNTHTHTLSLSQTAGLKLNKCAARQSVPNPATDTVTGHARGCACEQACPKLESMWIRKYGFPLPSVSKQFFFFTHLVCMYTTIFLMKTEIK